MTQDHCEKRAPHSTSRRLCRAVLVAGLLGLLACGDDHKAAKDSCTPGTDGCKCAAGNMCNDGLTCESAKCTHGEEVSVLVPAEARACEVLLEEAGSKVVGVSFADGTTGTFIREAPRVAVTFYSNADAPIGDLTVQVADDGELPNAAVTHCFDALGKELSDVNLVLGG